MIQYLIFNKIKQKYIKLKQKQTSAPHKNPRSNYKYFQEEKKKKKELRCIHSRQNWNCNCDVIARDTRLRERGNVSDSENESRNSLWGPPRGSPPGRVCRSPPRWCLLAWVQHVRPPNPPPPSKCRHPPLRTIHRLSIRAEAAWRLVRDQC